jgi:hypothetical protein
MSIGGTEFCIRIWKPGGGEGVFGAQHEFEQGAEIRSFEEI